MNGDLEKLKILVWQNDALMKELAEITDRKYFAERILELGKIYGLQIDNEEIAAAIRANSQVLIEKWS